MERDQVLIEAKIVETNLNDTENLGIDWTMKVTSYGAQRAITWPFSQSTSNKFAQDDFIGVNETTLGSENIDYSKATVFY